MSSDSLTEFILDRLHEREQDIRTLTVWPEAVVMQELAFGSALRLIVATHREALFGELYPGACRVCGGADPYWPCSTMSSIATVYAGHPDFDPAWALSTRR